MSRVSLQIRLQPASSADANRAEPNPSMQGVTGFWLLPASDIPAACVQARQLSRLFPEGALHEDSWVEVVHLQNARDIAHQAASPSGEVRRYPGQGLWLDVDRHQRFCRIYLLPEFQVRGPLNVPQAQPVRVSIWHDQPLGPLLNPFPSCFVSGLISLSAEPPEGFFAAATAAELSQAGYPQVSAPEADVWLYRVPDARTQSYFDFIHPNPGRPEDTPRQGKFLIACGVGPASEPTSSGGREADLLWLGDEQHGPLRDYLKTLQQPDLRLSHFRKHQGLAQRLPADRVILCRVNRCWGLSKQGFNQLPTDPQLYRQVFSSSYDDYLRSLFLPQATPADASYLLATSRGCTQGCAICCSGGLKAFQSFSASRMLEELHKIRNHAKVDGLIDIFFLDSNFNNHPERIIEFADLYAKSPLFGRFRFFVRHNTVNGFLRPGNPKRPHLELIEAFRKLGIHEVFMGVDTFDDHSTLTLKSNRLHMMKKGSQTRPTYSVQELRQLIEALQNSGARVKAFYLRNNPWVTDLDRIDSYYNIAELWLRYPGFSIDARNPDVNRLKPFAGSPIEHVSRQLPQLLRHNRYQAPGVLGEIDESLDFSVFGAPQSESDSESALTSFASDLKALRQAAANRFQRLDCPQARRILAKIAQRDRQLLAHLPPNGGQALRRDIQAFAESWSHLPQVSPEEQRHHFERAAASLFEGLRQSLPQPRRSNRPLAAPVVLLRPHQVVSQGYRASVPHRLQPRAMQVS